MLLLATLLSTSSAWAGSCDATVNKIGSLTTETVVAGFNDLARCDRKLAEANFNRFLEKATDSGVLEQLMMAAISAEVWNPAWTAVGKIQSYEARDEVTRAVGAACIDNPKVVTFLKGAFAGLREADFQQWDYAFVSCPDEALRGWIDEQVRKPPTASFDEKYDTLLAIHVRSRKIDALPALTVAAIQAGKSGGPFDAILSRMGEAAAGDMGAAVSADSQAKLEASMVEVAKGVPPELSRAVANTLANSGSDAAAASLLGSVFPDRVQAGGGFLYGALVIEQGDCGGKKTAVLHYTTATEPGKRWTILSALEEPMRAMKPKLKGCTVDSPWAVIQSPEPLKSASEVEDWADTVLKDYLANHKDYKASLQKEKGIALP